MLVNQIIGRAWRLGQQEVVLVYNMVALGTVDVLMVEHGEGKGTMLEQFLSVNSGTHSYFCVTNTNVSIQPTRGCKSLTAGGRRWTARPRL